MQTNIFVKLTFDGDVPDELWGVLPRFGVIRWTYTHDNWVSFIMTHRQFAMELLTAFNGELIAGNGNLRSIEAKKVGGQEERPRIIIPGA